MRLKCRLAIHFVVQQPYLAIRRKTRRAYFVVMIKVIHDTVGLLLQREWNILDKSIRAFERVRNLRVVVGDGSNGRFGNGDACLV